MFKAIGSGFGVVVLVGLSGIGCGQEAAQDAAGEPTVSTSAALTTSQGSFLVSFSGGSIPTNAAALVAGAGGTIVARYQAVGVILARSDVASASFASYRVPAAQPPTASGSSPAARRERPRVVLCRTNQMAGTAR